jgi:xylan 1,4-beta-xylosidase
MWYCGSINGDNKIPPRRYPAEDRIYVQQLDPSTGQFIGERHIVSSGYAINSPYAEAPHIYKIKGKYYLMIAEGGTWENHAVSVFTADNIVGPYTPFICNPVLTHRHLGNDIDITTIGHADLVQTQNGDWYSVMLGVRPVNGFNMLGRETFLTPVEFQGEQPIFNPGVGRVLMEEQFPKLPECPVIKPDNRDEFNGQSLAYCWNFLRTPFEKWYELKDSKLQINLRPQRVSELVNPSLIARRVEHHKFYTACAMQFNPTKSNEEAGMVIMQNDRFHYRLTIVGKGDTPRELRLIQVKNGKEAILAHVPYRADNVILSIQGDGLKYAFYYGETNENMRALCEEMDATVCSTNVARGFIGPYVGMYASSNGEVSKRKATFSWFEYAGF